MTVSRSRRDVQQDNGVLTAGFSNTLFQASFFIASSINAPARRHTPIRRSKASGRSKQSRTRDMPAAPLEVMSTIAQSVSADATYQGLSSTTRDLQDRIRQQYQQKLEKRSDQASLRRLEAATQAKKTRLTAASARSDRESLQLLQAASRDQKAESSPSRRASSSSRYPRKTIRSATSVSKYLTDGGAASTPRRSPSHSARASAPVVSRTSLELVSATNAAAQTTALRMQALSPLVSSAESFVEVESAPSTPSSSLFRLPIRPIYHRALDTDPGPSTAPARPWLPQRMLTAFPEIGRIVGAVAPQPLARTFTRVDSGAYSSDNPSASDGPLRPLGESRSPSWSSQEEVGGAAKMTGPCATEDNGSYHETPSKSSRQSQFSGWTSEEEAPISVQEEDVSKTDEVYEVSPPKTSMQGPFRQPQSPSWSRMEEVLESKTLRGSVQARSTRSSSEAETLDSARDDFIGVEEESEQSSWHAGEEYGSDGGSVKAKGSVKSGHFGEDGEVEEFEDWEDLGDEERLGDGNAVYV